MRLRIKIMLCFVFFVAGPLILYTIISNMKDLMILVPVYTLLFVLFYLLLDHFLKPLDEVKHGIAMLKRCEPMTLEPETDDEIGQIVSDLSVTSKALMRKKQDLLSGSPLKKQLVSQNREMEVAAEEMQASRLATLNMMEDLDTAYKQLKEESKLKDELFNITSHELKSPLVPIVGYVDLLQHGQLGSMNAQQIDAVNIIGRNADRLSNLIEDVLDIARLQAGKMKFNFKNDSLRDVLHEVEQRFKKAVEDRGMHLLVDMPDKVPSFVFDKSRMVQVFSNLLQNALKFTDKGAISMNVRRVGDSIIIEVADTGIGISKQDLQHIFEKFYQAESSLTRKHGGSGLGLSIVEGIVHAHNGQITAHSVLGKGSVFTVTLPVHKVVEEKRKINIEDEMKKLHELRSREARKMKKEGISAEDVSSFFK